MLKSMLLNAELMAILSIFDVQTELAHGELAFLKIEDSKLEKEELVIAVPSNRRPSPAAQAAIALLRGALTDIASTQSMTENVS
jgi:DNA-binding transcriptional LysR family regulator